MEYSLLLLFPAGMVVGWILFDKFKNKTSSSPKFSAEYFKGLNYLINEEQDKAISVFTQMLESNPETVETHLALGALFRQRGETSKAISIHKTLIEKENLNTSQRKEALREIGKDYLKAGMLDRAAEPFKELLAFEDYRQDALMFLAQIYDQEQEWDKAITSTNDLYELSGDDKWKVVLSHYWCEKAKRKIKQQDYKKADAFLEQALLHNNNCVRASILKAESLQSQGEHAKALETFKNIELQNPLYIPEILEPLLESYSKTSDPEEILEYLHGLLERSPSTSLALALVDKVRDVNGLKAAESLLVGVLQNRPSVRGLEFLITLNLDKEDTPKNKFKLQSLKSMMAQLQEGKPSYQCNHCGFQAQELHWQCPGCRHWSSIEPIVGVAGE